jgi:hypothetical protein
LVAGDVRWAAESVCGVGFGGAPVKRRDFSRFWGRRGRRRCRRACCRGAVSALGLGWARVEDESKCRCQGLVVCRATLPFEGFCDARPGVTLAPAFFFGVAACQSRTIRL